MGLFMTNSASSFDHSEMSLKLDPERPCCLRDEPESVFNAVIGEVPLDCRGTKSKGEDGWKFDELELVQGVAGGWEKGFKFGIVGFGEGRSLWEGPHRHVCWDHGKLVSDQRGVNVIEI